MSDFLIRDDTAKTGYRTHNGMLPRTREESYVPWALSADGHVVYAPSNQYRNTPTRGGLRSYNNVVSQDRRKLA